MKEQVNTTNLDMSKSQFEDSRNNLSLKKLANENQIERKKKKEKPNRI